MTDQLLSFNSPINICVAGESRIKLTATASAVARLKLYATVSSTAIPSTGIDEQPVGYTDILQGAGLRSRLARQVKSERGRSIEDLYIGIENGIEEKDGVYSDYAVVFICFEKIADTIIEQSAKCVFPTASVLATQNLPGGFKFNTVGKYLESQGIVAKHDDPHIDLCGRHRALILSDTIVKALLQISKHSTFAKV